MQREIEASGIPTVSLSNHPAVTRLLRVPRWVQVRFPRGAMLGEPGNRDKQHRVLGDALAALAGLDTPGACVELPHRWEAPGISWRGRELTDAQSR